MKFNFASIPKYCISLKRSIDRRGLIYMEFRRHGLDVTQFDAIDGQSLQVPELSPKLHAEMPEHAPGILGCMMSHLEVMKQARARKEDCICVFEDDIVLCDDFGERIKYMESLNDFDFNFISLGGCFPNIKNMGSDAHDTQWNHIFKFTAMNGTYAYIIKAEAMDFVIRNATYVYGADEFFSNFLYKMLNAFAFVPFLVGLRFCKSEITGAMDGINTKWYRQEEIKDFNIPYENPLDTEDQKTIKKIDIDREKWLRENP